MEYNAVFGPDDVLDEKPFTNADNTEREVDVMQFMLEEERALLRRYHVRSGRLTVAWFRSRATATWKHRHELTATYLPELLPPGTMPARLRAGR